MKTQSTLLLALAVLLAAPVEAQTTAGAHTPVPPPAPPAAAAAALGNAQTGQQLATAGTPNGVTACVGCHGAQGEGNAAGGFPRIGGQSAYYLAKQLGAYADGSRVNPIMQPIAKAINLQQMRGVAAYYASLGGGAGSAKAASDGPAKAASGGSAPSGGAGASAKAGAAPKGKAGSSQGRAEQLSSVGDESKQVQACANCHGPGGMGQPPVYPSLAGQHANYLTATMTAWRDGTRKTDGSGQMPHIAKQLGDADVAALSAYFSAQPVPEPAGKMVNIAAGSVQRPAVAAQSGAGPKAAPTGASGTGTEQGSPLTGGGQGPGGGGGTKDTNPAAPGSGGANQQGKPPVPPAPPVRK
ncbi:MAG: c-type cytochrome [Massilia sp.]